ncbi:MAG: hypothetical protein LBB63_02080 [Holosporaceae bacterium]|nr:hypothetical protein [Holosporaceae bacterium]
MSEDVSIFEEINEELKNDRLFAFFKANRNAILTVVGLGALLIVVFSSWHMRKNAQMERITTALINVIQSPTQRNEIAIAGLLENAPAELKPLLIIMKYGKKLSGKKEIQQSLDALLDLSKRRGVDVIWGDLALLIYATYCVQPTEKILKMLEPLAKAGRPFRFTALELMAVICEKSGDHAKALEFFKKITSDANAPASLKSRVAILSGYINGLLEG